MTEEERLRALRHTHGTLGVKTGLSTDIRCEPLNRSPSASARGESRTRTGLPPVDFESSAGPTPSTIKAHNRQHPQRLCTLGALTLLSGVALDGRWWRHTQEHTVPVSGPGHSDRVRRAICVAGQASPCSSPTRCTSGLIAGTQSMGPP